MVRLEVQDQRLQSLLQELKNRIENRQALMRRLAADLKDSVIENFNKEGRPRWKTLYPKTIKERQKKGKWPGKILQVTGMLRRSLTTRADNDSAIVGTNLRYAAIHQFGGTVTIHPRASLTGATFNRLKNGQVRFAKSGTKKSGSFSTLKRASIKNSYQIDIPARPFLMLPEKDVGLLKRRIEEWLIRKS